MTLLDPTDARLNDERLGHLNGAPTHQFALPYFGLRREPALRSAIDTEILFGEGLNIISEKDGWAQVVSNTDAYQGWLPKEAIVKGWAAPTHMIAVPFTHIYPSPNMKKPPMSLLSMGCLLTLKGEPPIKGFVAVAGGGWISASHVRMIGDWSVAPLGAAAMFLNMPYLWGGRTAQGIDCSALIQLTFAQCGVALHRDSDLQYASLEDAGDTPQAGDLAFFPGHVGIMLDAQSILHANATHMRVTIDPLDDVISWVAKEGHSRPFLGFKKAPKPT